MGEKCEEAQEAAGKYHTRTLYRRDRELAGDRSISTITIKDENGNKMLTADEQDAYWVEYFKEMLNQPDSISIFHFVNVGPIAEKEAEGVVWTLKNNKVPLLDWITAELVKYSGPSMIKEST